MAVENVQVSSQTGIDGNAITTNISNDKLTNQDFLKLMLEQLKMQDPTKPMDSNQMLQNQMQMSTIETNQATIRAMESLQKSFSNVGLTTAASMMGRIIENGDMSEKGTPKRFLVDHVETDDGEVYVSAKEFSHVQAVVNGPNGPIDYDKEGNVIEFGEKTGFKIELDDDGAPKFDKDTRRVTIIDPEGKEYVHTEEKEFTFKDTFRNIYKTETTNILLEKVTKIL